jgi:hypothetical protein
MTIPNSLNGNYDGKRLTLNDVGSTLFFSDRPEGVNHLAPFPILD